MRLTVRSTSKKYILIFSQKPSYSEALTGGVARQDIQYQHTTQLNKITTILEFLQSKMPQLQSKLDILLSRKATAQLPPAITTQRPSTIKPTVIIPDNNAERLLAESGRNGTYNGEGFVHWNNATFPANQPNNSTPTVRPLRSFRANNNQTYSPMTTQTSTT